MGVWRAIRGSAEAFSQARRGVTWSILLVSEAKAAPYLTTHTLQHRENVAKRRARAGDRRGYRACSGCLDLVSPESRVE